MIGTWSSPRAIAEGFAGLFSGKHASEEEPDDNAFLGARETPPAVRPDEVRSAIAQLNTGKSCDPEGLDAELLQLLPPSTYQWLAAFFNICLDRGLPRGWKESVVVPVLKPGKNADEASSYRPVALTSILCKTLEHVVLTRVLAGPWRLAATQYGFRPGCGTDEALAHLNLCLADARDCRLHTLVAGVDMTDAFCRVRRSSFVREYLRLGFPRCYGHFFDDFLRGRSLVVRVDGRLSRRRGLTVGTPQGSVLGPFLWSVVVDRLVGDLHDHLSSAVGFGPRPGRVVRNIATQWCGVMYYADDGVIWLSGDDVAGLVRGANRALQLVADFCSAEGIGLSSKSSATLFGRPTTQEYVVHCGALELPARPGTERVLGVHFGPGLTLHTTKALEKGRRALGIVISLRRLLSVATCRDLVLGAVLSPVIYGMAACFGSLAGSMWNELEFFFAACARVVTEAVATARTDVVLCEAGLPTAKRLVAERAALLCERIIRRDVKCPLRRRFLTPPSHAHITHSKTLRDAIADETRLLRPSALAPLLLPRSLPVADSSLCTILPSAPGGLAKSVDIACRLAAVTERVASIAADVVCFCDASVVEATSSSPAMSSAAYRATGLLTSQASFPLGPLACSYTAEAKALHRLVQHLVLEHGKAPSWSSVVIFTDSQSCLAALAHGPRPLADALIARIWEGILGLTRSGVRVTLAFIFGHVGYAPHDAVDEDARLALADAPATDVWWQDGARPHLARLRTLEESKVRTGDSWWAKNNKLTDATRCPRISHAAGKAIMRLRTGVDPHIGGWRHNVIDCCPLCATPLTRGSESLDSGIVHFWHCPAEAAVAHRSQEPLQPADLWDPKKWSRVLAYRELFTG